MRAGTPDSDTGRPADPLDIITPEFLSTMAKPLRFLRASPLLRHLPFLFWIVETARPQSFLQLGSRDLVPYFAVCQAMDGVVPLPRCAVVGDWDDDPDIPQDVRRHSEEHHPGSSKLLKPSSDEGFLRLPNASVDILLIDVDCLDQDRVRLLPDWQRVLSSKGILLTYAPDQNQAPSSFGPQFQQVSEERPTIRFSDHPGLTAVLVGPEQDERLLDLAGSPLLRGTQALFARFGSAYAESCKTWHQIASQPDTDPVLKIVQRQLEEARQSHLRLENELLLVNRSYDRRAEQAAILHAQNFDLERLQDERAAELQRQKLEISQLSETLARGHRELATLARLLETRDEEALLTQQAHAKEAAKSARKLSQFEREFGVLGKKLKKAEGDLAKLAATSARKLSQFEKEFGVLGKKLKKAEGDLANSRKQLKQTQGHLANSRKELKQVEGDLASLRKEHRKVQSERDAVLSSTAWKATRPLRWTITQLRSRGRKQT